MAMGAWSPVGGPPRSRLAASARPVDVSRPVLGGRHARRAGDGEGEGAAVAAHRAAAAVAGGHHLPRLVSDGWCRSAGGDGLAASAERMDVDVRRSVVDGCVRSTPRLGVRSCVGGVP